MLLDLAQMLGLHLASSCIPHVPFVVARVVTLGVDPSEPLSSPPLGMAVGSQRLPEDHHIVPLP
jgi:hypothetical protein